MSINNKDIFDEIERKLNEYFSDPKNVEEFKSYLDEELKKPYYTQLQCNTIWCKYNRPKNPDMGTITYCSKYKDTKKNKYICEKREWFV